MNSNTILDYFKKHQTAKVKFAFADMDGILRGKIISTKKLLDSLEKGMGFCDVVFGWDSNDDVYDESVTVTGWHSGYPDKICRVDLASFRIIPWQNNLPFFIADFSDPGISDASSVCPRTLLKIITAEAKAMGFTARFAQEFEWFNFKESPKSLEEKNYVKPEPLTPGMFGYSILRPSMYAAFNNDLFDLLGQFNIPLEGLHTETGPGVYEAAIEHDVVVNAADKAVLFKNAVKEIAFNHGIMASFMAKWNETLPGCSGHLHQSLWNDTQTINLFHSESDHENISDLLRHYIAGQLHCLPHILPMYAPTVNSYKRLVEGAWAPVTLTWAFDNRTAALRVLTPNVENTRLETRVPGSDSNPYLAMAASLASGLYGIKHKLPLVIQPSTGNAYEDISNGVLPANLFEAATAMKNSSVAKELFGETFTAHFTATRLLEWQKFMQQVTDWEIKRYFEII
ncbi:MAG: glutamine synthetase [Bacteroidota bacterium]